MCAETTLYDALRNDGAVVAIVGTRIYPIFVPDSSSNNLPAIAFQRTSTTYENTIHNSDLARLVVFDVYCVADGLSVSVAENLADQVCAVSYQVGDETVELVKTNRSSTYDPDSNTVLVIITVEVWE